MLYGFLLSKKGFTLVELVAVMTVLGILTVIAVPAFTGAIKEQKLNDCRNQRLVIETAVKQAMYGMVDNGKRQPKITFVYGGSSCNDNDDTEGEKFFKLTADDTCFTLAELRGGYRPSSIEDYKDGCDKGYYLKKSKYDENLNGDEAPYYFYYLLNNQEVPVCPFADETNSQGYYYCIFEDGTVCCTCPECNEIN